MTSGGTHRLVLRAAAVLTAIVLVGAWVWQRSGSAPAVAAVGAQSEEIPPIPQNRLPPAGTAPPGAIPTMLTAGEPAVSSLQHDGAPAASTGDARDAGQSPSEPDGAPEASESPSGETYTYWDGDTPRTVTLVPVEPDASPEGGDPGDRGAFGAGWDGAGADRLVFRSEQGVRMALSHSVVLVLDPGWSSADVNRFLARNGVPPGSVSPLGWLPNGFTLSTGPGVASLELANALARQEGVVLASPNWASEVETK